ncbi:MAG: transglycosylase domain-containing protein [bacterium]
MLLAVLEMRTSRFQAFYFSRMAKKLSYKIEQGPSPAIRFPEYGPYDERLGYTSLPSFIKRLTAAGYNIERQARFSPELIRITETGFFTPYHEKTQAGLLILDGQNRPFFNMSYPERVYSNFSDIPEIIVRSLLFIENKDLLNPDLPYMNPAVEWDRLIRAIILKGWHIVDREERVPGASTLATQKEKYLHSPQGWTASIREKYRQMVSASLRAYLKDEKTAGIRKDIVLDYLNFIPLGAIPGYGQVNGLGDGMYAYYGADFHSMNMCLQEISPDNDIEEWAAYYKQVLSFFIAQRRPSFYLVQDNEALESKTNSYIRLLSENGIITPRQRDTALSIKLEVRRRVPEKIDVSFVERKTANAIRPKLLSLLSIPRLYDLDLLDLTVKSTLNSAVQDEITCVLKRLHEPAFAEASGLRSPRLLEKGDPSRIIYSFTLYESVSGINLLRIQTDNYNQPFNINEGIKLELGSSAKLRTLVTYLEVMAGLHSRYAPMTAKELGALKLPGQDRLSRWAVDYLLKASDRSLTAMLGAAMERRYSASPGESFFTGGGRHVFSNFDDKYDGRVITVREAFHNSVNLVFIRMMRDIVRYYIFQRQDIVRLFEDVKHPKRDVYLKQFADREGTVFLRRFYNKYRGKDFEAAFEALIQGISPRPVRLTVIFRSLKPEAGIDEFTAFLRQRLPGSPLSEEAVAKLYKKYALEAYSLIDRGYLARVHPLELWMLSYLRLHPGASINEVLKAGENERQEVYTWLFKTHRKNAQDNRIRLLLEVEAFSEIHRSWKRLKYPFDFLVPSYATAIGSSADRPVSLAELVGIIMNNGVWYPSVRLQELHFARNTPYETLLKRKKVEGEKVLLPEIAEVVKEAMIGVVEKGTARRLHNVFTTLDGQMITVGGKTGTGDNRFEVYGPGGRRIKSVPLNRTAVFVFFIGDRFFGTITAYTDGPGSARYNFTSGLPVQVLKTLAPSLMPLIESNYSGG